ncbi:MAG TPA: winged helix-turn-helix domain-containing protein [Gemmatimonadales bacterium]|nr:winged helix-turn-helix domain-containing protein [Gemmatimonadales bacterium]
MSYQEAQIVSELLAELFSSRVRSAVLTLLLPRPHLAFSLTDMSRRLGLPLSSLQHECYKLARLELLHDERRGNTRLYRPNPAWPLLPPLTALVVGAIPAETALAAAIEQVGELESVWVVHGLESEKTTYLVVVGSLDVESLDGVYARSRIALELAVNSSQVELAFFRPIDWAQRIASGDAFAATLLGGKRVLPEGSTLDGRMDRGSATGSPG